MNITDVCQLVVSEGFPMTCMLVESYQNGVTRNTGRFARDILKLLILRLVITCFDCHTTCVEGRLISVETHSCYDYAKMLRLNQHTRTVSSLNYMFGVFQLRVSNPRPIAYVHFNVLFESSTLPGPGPIFPD